MDETKKKALALLDRRDMSRKELTDKLLQKGEPPEAVAAAADRLEELGFLNDGRYAALVVRHYAGKGYGPARVRQELHRRGIARALWDAAMEGRCCIGEITRFDTTGYSLHVAGEIPAISAACR